MPALADSLVTPYICWRISRRTVSRYNGCMKLALLGIDDDALDLVRWAVAGGGHELVAAYDVGSRAAEVRALAPRAQLNESWEALVLGSMAEAVIVGRGGAELAGETGIADSERRAEQLRKLVQAAVPLLVVCPACESIVGFEIEMIRRDAKAVIVPYVSQAEHPAIRSLAEIVSWGESSPLGAVEQISLEREQADRSRPAVLEQLSRDLAAIRQLIGTIHSVSASGPAASLGRDPLGPKLKELPSLANLSVHVVGDEGLSARWSIGPALARPSGRLTVTGQRGKAVLQMPNGEDWSLEVGGDNLARESFAARPDPAGMFRKLSHAISTEDFKDDEAWLAAARDQEAAEAVDRSLARGRTIELLGEEHTEEDSFKGVMAMGGCLLLALAVCTVFVATIVEGLRLPLRNWPVWKLWPVYLLAPIVVFLLLQLFQLAIKRETPDLRRLVGSEDSPR